MDDMQSSQPKTNSKIGWWVLGIVVVVLVVMAVANRGSGPKETGPITLGFIGPLTGDAAALGQNAMSAVQIAVDEVNSSGGIGGRQLKVVYEDGQCTGKVASAAASKLINVDKVPVILGGACSGETSSFTSAAEQAQVVVLSYCSSAPAISQAGDYIFRDYPSDLHQGSYTAEYAYKTLGKRKAAIVYVKSDWGQGIRDVFKREFEARGGSVVADEGYDQTSRDLRTQLTKIKGSGADFVYFLGYTEASIVGLKQAQQLGLNLPMLGGDAWDDPKIFSEAGTAANGIEYVVVYAPLNSTFRSSMKAKVGSDEIGVCTPTAYDAVKLIAQVIGDVGTSGEAIKNALYKTVYSGSISAAEISFDENGDPKSASYAIKRVTSGKASYINAQ